MLRLSIKQFEKQVLDYAIYPCVSCEQLHKKSGMKEVYFDDFKENDVWLAIKGYQIQMKVMTLHTFVTTAGKKSRLALCQAVVYLMAWRVPHYQ